MGMVAAADLVDALGTAHVLEGAQLAEAARLQGFVADAKGLAGDLIQRGWLTPFQANLLLQGRGQDLLLGSYVLLERLGEGGMGTVYKARQRSLGRIVALKVIRKDRVVDPQAVKRFQREIRAAAQLNHPNIVRAFDADEIDGTHLLVMEYVEHGADLSQIVKRDGPLPIATACEYMRQAALGLQHAHERGLVHRDIKPANLLLAGVRNQVSGVSKSRSLTPDPCLLTPVVKILDMGLARLDHPDDQGHSSTSLTGEGAVMGTVDYIAPEQAMDSHHADIRADLYSLGCTFYYLLTGRVPFPGGDAVGKLIRQQTEEPEPFEFFRPEVAPALAAIVRKLMAKRKEDRFQTPAELAVALEDVMKKGVEIKGQKFAAKSQSKSVSGTVVDPKLARQWAEVVTPGSATQALVKAPGQFIAPARNFKRGLAVAGTAAALLLILLLWQPWRRGEEPTPDAGISKSKTRPPSAKELAEKAERKRQAEAEEALKPIAARMASLSAGASSAGEALRKELREFLIKHSATPAATKACELLGQVLAKLPSPLDQLDPAKIPDDAKAEWKKAGFDGNEVVAVLGEHRRRHWGNVNWVSNSPDGKLLATAGADSIIRLWDTDTMRERAWLKGHSSHVLCVTFSPDGANIASSSNDGTARLWETATGRELYSFNGLGSWLLAVAISPNGKILATGGNELILWEIETRKELRRLKGHKPDRSVQTLAFSKDGKLLISGSSDTTAIVWNVETSEEVCRFQKHKGYVYAAAFDSTGTRGLTYDGGRLYVWEIKSGKQVKTYEGPVSLSVDGRKLLYPAQDKNLRVLDLETGEEQKLVQESVGAIGPVGYAYVRSLFSTDGQRMFLGGMDGSVRVWDLKTGKEVQPLAGQSGPVRNVAYNFDDTTLAARSAEGVVKVWDLPSGKERHAFVTDATMPSYSMMNLAFLGDSHLLASVKKDVPVQIWDVVTGEERRAFRTPQTVVCLGVSPDGKALAAGGFEGNVRLWDLTTGQEGRLLEGPKDRREVFSLAFSPDSKLLATASWFWERSLRLWHVETGKELWGCPGGSDGYSVAFHPDGQSLATAGNDDAVRLFDAITGKERWVRKDVGAWTAFAPDGKTLAAASGAGRITILDPVAGKVMRQWKLPGPVHGLAFANDGRHLATANGNGTVYIFRVADGPPRALSTAQAKKQQQDATEHFGVPVEVENSIGMKLRLIPPGRFLMGSPDNEPARQLNEGPQHEVTITKPFHIGVYEVTQAQYEKVTGKNPSKFNKDNGGGPDHPVEMVSWDDAVAFCKELSEMSEEKKAGRVYRLPTEAEWEYAYRAGTQTVYHFGDDARKLGQYGWVPANSQGKTHPVGLLQPNAWGLHDMVGNVKERCADWYDADAYQAAARQDPQGPGTGKYKVLRGGDFTSFNPAFRAANRSSVESKSILNRYGFRVVCEYRPPQITNSIGMKLARIPAGKFLMGSPDNEPGRKPEEGPQHEVTIRKPFLIGVHEVTQEQYEKVAGTNPAEFNKNNGGAADHPVETVSWDDAVAFCKKLSESPAEKKAGRVYRLPTEAEWEYAYRAGTQARFPFGDDKTIEHAWLLENADGKTHAASRLRPNPWGLFDMGGNVWEFAADYYDAAGYPAGPRTDPQGPATGQMRVVRGSGFDYPAAHARAAARGYHPQDKKDSAVGFRVVCEIPPSTVGN